MYLIDRAHELFYVSSFQSVFLSLPGLEQQFVEPIQGSVFGRIYAKDLTARQGTVFSHS